ncbi:unnamed protein product [Gongylonema pulchrum]|uniref:Amidinotransferase n=1 Tax=Gongylonema pulchrum TaxID=637853 RepID=A0A183EY30_9BILA|nr:unnamed protein product [Gongylonema pulchrum]
MHVVLLQERSGEQEHYRRWFKEHGFDVLGDSYPEYFEGGGDACFSTYETLWAGYGHRSGKSITKRMPDVISISDAEADAFVCNAITIRKMVLSPKGVSAETKHRLSKRGFGVMEFDMSEFMKSGGACQCLILKL